MPNKKPKRDAEPAKPPPVDSADQDQRRGQESASGLTGRGADSALAQLREQEKIRARKARS
jgi:hypothetical protein